MYSPAVLTKLALTLLALTTILATATAFPTPWSTLRPSSLTHHYTPSTRKNFIAKDCAALVEDMPWQLKNLVVRNTTDPNGLGSSICFDFCDANPGLQMETTCNLTITATTLADLDRSGGYARCQDEDVSFAYSPGKILVERKYEDDCLGYWPYNSGAFFGQGVPSFGTPTKTSDGGEWMSQTVLEIPITSQD